MSKSRRSHSSRQPLLIILVLSLVIAIGYTVYRASATPTNIFVIEPTPLTYGNTTLTGFLQKNAPAGSPGIYLLVLPDSRAIKLDLQNQDALLGSKITLSGYLSPADAPTDLPTLTSTTIISTGQ